MKRLLILPLFQTHFVSTKTMDTKVEFILFENCFISGLGLIYRCHYFKVASKSAEFRENSRQNYHFQQKMDGWVVIYSIYNSFIHLLICLFLQITKNIIVQFFIYQMEIHWSCTCCVGIDRKLYNCMILHLSIFALALLKNLQQQIYLLAHS